MMLRLLSLMLLMFSVTAKAATAPGSLFTYEGILTDSGGTPITTTQTVTFQVLYGSCILLEETQSIAPGSDGEFSAIIGIGTRVDSTGNTADRIFASSGSVNCSGSSAVSMSGFSTRTLHIKVGSTDLSPDVTIGNIPMAINSQKLGDKGASDFLQVNTSNGATQTNLESVLARTTELTSLLNAYSGNTLSAQTAVTATTAATATNFTGSLAGDVTGTQSATTVEKIRGINVDSTAPTSGQILKYVSGKWTPSSESVTSAVTSVTGTSGQITVTGSTAPVLSLASVGTAGTYLKVVTDAQGRVTSGSTALTATDIPSLDWTKITSGTPTTLSGYGITDAVKNGGNAPSIQSGTDTAKPTAGTVGRLYVATDTKIIYRDNGSTWDIVSSATGSGGTITSVVAGTGMTGGGSTGAVTLNANVGTTANQIVQLNSSAQLPAVDGSLLTNIATSALTGILPIAKGGTGASAFVANRLIASNGTGSVLQPFTCSLGQLVTFDASGIPGCSTLSTAGVFANGGNSFGAAAVLGTTDSYALQLMTNSSTAMTIGPAGNIGIGTTSPSSKMDIYNGELRIRRDDNYANALVQASSDTYYPALALLRSRGSLSTPTATAAGDVMGALWAMDGLYQTGKAGLSVLASEAHSSSANGMSLNFYTVANGTTTTKNSMTINPAGNVGIGNTSPSVPLVVSAAGGTFTDGHFIVQDNSHYLSDVASQVYISGRDSSLNPLWMLGDYSATAKLISLNAYDSSYALSLNTNNTPRIYIDPAGAVGFGTSTPNIGAFTTGPGTITLSGGGSAITDSGVIELNNPISTVSAATFGGKISFNASANAGSKTLGFMQVISEGSGGTYGYGGRILFSTKQDNSTTINSVVMTNLGYVGIGTASPTALLHVGGAAIATAWNTSSDRRLKENIVEIKNPLQKILNLRAVEFDWRKDISQPTPHERTHDIGVIAQEIEAQFPEAVTTASDGFKSVAYSKLVSPLIGSVHELYGMCKATEAQMATIERRIASIEEDSRSKDARIKKLEEENAILKKDLELIKTKLGL